MAKQTIDLEKIKPRDRDVFHAPEGYFDELTLRIAARIEEPQIDQKTSRTLFLYEIAGYAAAAAVALLLVWFASTLTNANQQNSEDLLADVATEDLVTYLESDGIGWLEIVNAYPDLVENAELFQWSSPLLDEGTETIILEEYDYLIADTL